MNKLSKAAIKRLRESEFFHEVEETVKAWDFYLGKGYGVCIEKNQHRKECEEMMNKWLMAKSALEFITGNLYGFSRDGTGNYSVVNERDYNERIIVGRNEYLVEGE